MSYIFVADDFTGASDTLATLARAGLRVRLFRDLPAQDDIIGLDAWGIATHARSLNCNDIVELAQYLGKGLAHFHPQFLHLKVCSTFDSSRDIGNIALFAKELAKAAKRDNIAVIGGQPSLGRYAIFGNLFAKAPDGQIYRIDRHPIMSAHPVTPMHEADLIRHLADLGLTGLQTIGRKQKGTAFPRFYDALEQADIASAGHDLMSLQQPVLIMGSSSVAEAWILSKQFSQADNQPFAIMADGPIFCFAGSRSSLTTAQIAAAETIARLPINPADMLAGNNNLEQARAWVLERLAHGQDCLAYLTADSAGNIPAAELARRSATFVRMIMSENRAKGLVVAGGDTSSAIVNALAPNHLDYAGDICEGVPVLLGNLSENAYPLVLKGGQMGGNNFFMRAISKLKTSLAEPSISRK